MKTTVTAQDFIKVFKGNADFNWVNITWEGKYCRGEDVTRDKFDALISQIYAAGRKDGLKEMDENWNGPHVEDLRAEYRN